MNSIWHKSPFRPDQIENNRDIFDGLVGVSDGSVKRGRGRPARHREDRVGSGEYSIRNRTIGEACHEAGALQSMPAGVPMSEIIRVALDYAETVLRMPRADRLYALAIMSAAAEHGGRIVWLSQQALIDRLHDYLSARGETCRITKIEGLRSLEKRLADYGLLWHVDALDDIGGEIRAVDGGRRGPETMTGLDLAPAIQSYRRNAAVSAAKAVSEYEEEERDRLRKALMSGIGSLFGEVSRLERMAGDKAAADALRGRAKGFSARRAALWHGGSLDEMADLLDEVTACLPRRKTLAHGADRISGGGKRFIARGEGMDPVSKMPTPPLLHNIQGAPTPKEGGRDSDVDGTALYDVISQQEIAHDEDRSRSCQVMSRSNGLGDSGVPPAAPVLEMDICADDYIPNVDGLGDQDNGGSLVPPPAREWRPDGIPVAVVTAGGCRALVEMIPALHDAVGSGEITGPADLIAAAESMMARWPNPSEIGGKPVNPKGLAKARNNLIAARGETPEMVAEWLVAVAAAANASRVGKLRESLASAILRNIRSGRFDASRFPTRQFWEAFAAAGGETGNVVRLPAPSASRSVEDVDPIMEMVTAPAPAPAPASKPVQVTDPTLAAAYDRVKATALLPIEKGPAGIVMPSRPTPTPAPAAVSPAPAAPVAESKASHIVNVVAKRPDVAAVLAAMKREIGIKTAPAPTVPVGRPMTREEDLAFMKAAVSATPTRCGEDLYPCSTPLRAVGVRPPPPLPVKSEPYCPEDLPDEAERDMPEEEYDPYDIDPHEHAARIRNGVEWPF